MTYSEMELGDAVNLTTYIRTNLFCRAKFVNTADLLKIEEELFIAVNIAKKKTVQNTKRTGLYALAKDFLSMRRQHVIRKVKSKLRSKWCCHTNILQLSVTT